MVSKQNKKSNYYTDSFFRSISRLVVFLIFILTFTLISHICLFAKDRGLNRISNNRRISVTFYCNSDEPPVGPPVLTHRP